MKKYVYGRKWGIGVLCNVQNESEYMFCGSDSPAMINNTPTLLEILPTTLVCGRSTIPYHETASRGMGILSASGKDSFNISHP